MKKLLAYEIIEPKQTADSAIIWLHGLGASGHDFVSLIPELGLEDYAIRFIFPHAPVQAVTLNFGMSMPAWYDIKGLSEDSAEDEEGVRLAATRINALITEQRQQGIAAERIFLTGFSQGGAVALFTALRYTETLAGVIALSTYLPLANFLAAEAQAVNKNTPIFLAYGKADTIVSNNLAYLSKGYLTDLAYPIEWHEYEMAHSVCTQEIEDIARFIKAKL